MRPFVLKSPLLCACVIALAAFNAGTASAAYPDRPIRYIVPSAAGGGADALARILAGELTKQLGQQVVVDNRAGASGAIGMDMLVRANPDGYTIGYGNTPLLAINKSLLPNWQYETGRDLQPVARPLVVGCLVIRIRGRKPGQHVDHSTEQVFVTATAPVTMTP